MISLRLLAMVLVTFGSRQVLTGEPPVDLLAALLVTLGVALGLALLHKVWVLRLLAQELTAASPVGWPTLAGLEARCSRAREIVETAWCGCLPWLLWQSGWGAGLHSWHAAGGPQALEVVGWFLPSLGLLALLELTAAQFDQVRQELTKPPIDVESSRDASSYGGQELGGLAKPTEQASGWCRSWWLRCRLGALPGLVACLLPVMLVLSLNDALALLDRNQLVPQALISHSWLAAMLLTLPMVGLFLPTWLGKWMGVVELPAGELRTRIEGQLRDLRVTGVGLRLVPSDGRLPGAAVVGWFPRFRQLWLGDALLERLTPQQLDMVVMHEVAHIVRRHGYWRVLPVGLTVAAIAGLAACCPEVGEVWGGGVPYSLLSGLLTIWGLSKGAHACELDADATACRLAVQTCEWARRDPRLPAAELTEALVRLLEDCPQAARTTWLHPSLRARRRNLESC